MSGGSLDYVYSRVEDAAREILSMTRNPLHVAFSKHLSKVSKALRNLEWVLSGDSSSPYEEESIRAVLQPASEVESAKEEAIIALKNLEDAINSLNKGSVKK
jgi:hypothetical protein